MQILQKPSATALLVAAAALSLGACDRHKDGNVLSKADPSAVVIGATPAPATGDPPGTTPVDPANEVPKAAEQNSMPAPGQPNDHSNLAANPSQRSDTSQKGSPQ